MNLQEIRRSPFTAATKSRMFLDYLNQLDETNKAWQEAFHYYHCYEALAIIQILEQQCQQVDSAIAASVYLFRETYFTAWVREDMIYQWDDTNAKEFLQNPEEFSFCIDKRFERWWVYPKTLLNRPELPNPVSASLEALVNLKARPVLFSASILLKCLEIGLDFTANLVQSDLKES